MNALPPVSERNYIDLFEVRADPVPALAAPALAAAPGPPFERGSRLRWRVRSHDTLSTCRVRIVHHQEILLYRIDGLNVRIVTAVALHIAGNQLHRRIARPAAAQTRQQIVVRAIQRQLEIKRMDALQRPMNKILVISSCHSS